MNRAERMTDLLAITSRLIACMEKEIGLLQSMRPQEMKALQLDKSALAGAYEAHIMALRGAPTENAVIAKTLRDELAEATERFQMVLVENARALRAVKEVNDRVLKAIASAVEESRGKPTGYTATGAPPAARRRAGAAALALSLDQRF
jgi:hypothetical protein